MTETEELENPLVKIIYNPADPNQVSTGAPCEVYEKIKDNPSRYPQWFEYISAGIFVIGLLFVQGGIRRAFTGR